MVVCLSGCNHAFCLSEGPACTQEPLLDERDAGKIVLTHIYLLAGCALPSLLCPTPGPGEAGVGSRGGIVPYAGVLILGVGDTVASIVGTFFGKWLWVPSEGRGKTVEGTVAGWVATTGSAMLLMHVQGRFRAPFYPNTISTRKTKARIETRPRVVLFRECAHFSSVLFRAI
jgi:CDP-diglyceride synthetase